MCACVWLQGGSRVPASGSQGTPAIKYLEVRPAPRVLRLHPAQQQLQVLAQPGFWLSHVLKRGLQRGPQRVDVSLWHQRARQCPGARMFLSSHSITHRPEHAFLGTIPGLYKSWCQHSQGSTSPAALSWHRASRPVSLVGGPHWPRRINQRPRSPSPVPARPSPTRAPSICAAQTPGCPPTDAAPLRVGPFQKLDMDRRRGFLPV